MLGDFRPTGKYQMIKSQLAKALRNVHAAGSYGHFCGVEGTFYHLPDQLRRLWCCLRRF